MLSWYKIRLLHFVVKFYLIIPSSCGGGKAGALRLHGEGMVAAFLLARASKKVA